MNKKIILLVLLLCFGVVLNGCSNKIPKTPDNFDKDLWRDSVNIINIIHDTIEKENNFSVEDENVINNYLETYSNRIYDNIQENHIIKSISDVYKNYNDYLLSKKLELSISLEKDKEKLEQSLLSLEKLYEELIK